MSVNMVTISGRLLEVLYSTSIKLPAITGVTKFHLHQVRHWYKRAHFSEKPPPTWYCSQSSYSASADNCPGTNVSGTLLPPPPPPPAAAAAATAAAAFGEWKASSAGSFTSRPAVLPLYRLCLLVLLVLLAPLLEATTLPLLLLMLSCGLLSLLLLLRVAPAGELMPLLLLLLLLVVVVVGAFVAATAAECSGIL